MQTESMTRLQIFGKPEDFPIWKQFAAFMQMEVVYEMLFGSKDSIKRPHNRPKQSKTNRKSIVGSTSTTSVRH